MYRMLKAALLVLAFAGPLGAQTQSMEREATTHWLFDIRLEARRGLGSRCPIWRLASALNNQLENILSCKGAYPTRQTRNTSPMTAARLK